MATMTVETQISTPAQKITSHPEMDAIDKKPLESLPAYEELDALYLLPEAPRMRKRYCALACFNCLLCCIPGCLWSCATSSCRHQQRHPSDDPHTLKSKECSWSCCCFGFTSRKRLYKPGVDMTPGWATGGNVGRRGQLHARPAQNYGETVKATNPRPVAVVPQRTQSYFRTVHQQA